VPQEDGVARAEPDGIARIGRQQPALDFQDDVESGAADLGEAQPPGGADLGTGLARTAGAHGGECVGQYVHAGQSTAAAHVAAGRMDMNSGFCGIHHPRLGP
jgi:hypothetical protein